jgi:hypothetical protein
MLDDWTPKRHGKQRCMPASQVCKTCNIDKPADAYARQDSKRSGLFAECKACQRLRNQRWIDENRERFRHINRAATGKMRRKDPVRAMVSLARARAKKAGLEFSITEHDVVIPSHCPVLGIELSFGLGRGKGQSHAERDGRASLDRIENSKGYIPGNVIVVSFRANRIKSDASSRELLKIARFYARLDTDKGGETSVPAVQPHEKEQNRPMLKRVS